MIEKIQSVFRLVFEDNSLFINETTSAKDIKMWDSLIHLELIAAVEDACSVEFTFDEVMSFNNVGDMLRSIEKKLK